MLRQIPTVTRNILIANVLIFLLRFLLGDYDMYVQYYGALHPLQSGAFRIWQPITMMFMHDQQGILHILFNMLILVQFGKYLEAFWGQKRFLEFYLICGIFASIAHLLLSPYESAVGASGAIMGVLVAFAMLYPDTELTLMFIPVPIKAKYMIPGLMALDLFGGLNPRMEDNVAHFAHLGGAAAGAVMVLIYRELDSRKRRR